VTQRGESLEIFGVGDSAPAAGLEHPPGNVMTVLVVMPAVLSLRLPFEIGRPVAGHRMCSHLHSSVEF
jgi:hypothetical protein